MAKYESSCVVGNTDFMTSGSETELIDRSKYEESFGFASPRIIGLEIINRGGSNIDIQINNGEVLSIRPNEGIDTRELVAVYSCKVLTDGANISWSGVLI